MNPNIPVVTLLCFLVAFLFVALLRSVVTRRREDVSLDGLLAISADRYRPMERLLDEADFRFLQAQAGYTAEVGRQFRAQRRRLFRCYLKRLRRDFGRLYTAGRLIALHSPVDRPELSKTLARQWAVFHFALATVEYRLALHGLGLGTVDVAGLVDALEAMQQQVRALMAPPAYSAA